MVTDRIIMFDFGGVIEFNSSKAYPGYDWKNVFGDAIAYATRMDPKIGQSFGQMSEELYHMFMKVPTEKTLMKDITTMVDTESLMGELIEKIVEEMGNRVTIDKTTAANDFVDYVTSTFDRIPVDYDVIYMEKYIATKCRIAAITNISYMWMHRFEQLTADIPYEFVWASYKQGCMKPEINAYAQVEEMANLTGNSILLIDDSEENVKAARQRGWYAYKVGHHQKAHNIGLVCEQFIRGDMSFMEY